MKMSSSLSQGRRRSGRDYSFLTEIKTYEGLSENLLDIAIRGIPFEEKRYPLSYIFWKKKYYQKVIITLTGESGILIGESIIKRVTGNFSDSHTGIVKIGDRITDLDFSVIHIVPERRC